MMGRVSLGENIQFPKVGSGHFSSRFSPPGDHMKCCLICRFGNIPTFSCHQWFICTWCPSIASLPLTLWLRDPLPGLGSPPTPSGGLVSAVLTAWVARKHIFLPYFQVRNEFQRNFNQEENKACPHLASDHNLISNILLEYLQQTWTRTVL